MGGLIMRFKIGQLFTAVLLMLGMAASSHAASVTPTFQTFGDLPEATFGGTGIPTNPTAFSTFTATNGDTLKLGLTATQRFNNAPVGNDGNGTFFAVAGLNDGTPGSNTGLLGATWNFDWFIKVTDNGGGSTIANSNISILYDFDPGVGTAKTLLGKLNILTNSLGDSSSVNQNSQNLAFTFLGLSFPGIITPPPGSFDPFAGGEYSFAIQSNLGEVAINVNVSPVPLPAAFPLFASGLALLGLFGWRRKRELTA